MGLYEATLISMDTKSQDLHPKDTKRAIARIFPKFSSAFRERENLDGIFFKNSV